MNRKTNRQRKDLQPSDVSRAQKAKHVAPAVPIDLPDFVMPLKGTPEYEQLLVWQGKGSAEFPEEESREELHEYQIRQLEEVIAELWRRERVTLDLFEPLPSQQELFDSTAKEILAFGSNRGAKTTACMVQLAMIVQGRHPRLSGMPWGIRKNGGRCAVVGYDLGHIGRVLYPKLFRPGAIKIIRDEVTGTWRSYRPWLPSDKAREGEAEEAPPLIPPEMIAPGGIAWLVRKLNIPKRIKLVNGWEIYFFSSEGEPPQGDDYDLAVFDEEMQRPDFYTEISVRLLTRKGFFLWGATGHVGGDALVKLADRAQQQVNDPSPRVKAIFFGMDMNPHLDPEERALLKDKFANDPDAYRARIEGVLMGNTFRVYPEFSIKVHGFDLKDLKESVVPEDWARWMILDPGRQKCATAFMAMPPDEHMILQEGELYITECTARKWASAVEIATRGKFFEAAIIDGQAARVHEMTSGITREQLYWEALDELGVWDRFRHKRFIYGSTDIESRVESVHDWLAPGEEGTPYYRIAIGRCPNTEREFVAYVNTRVKTPSGARLTDKPNAKSPNDCMNCLEYAAAFRPQYRRPRKKERAKSNAVLFMEAKRKRERQDSRGVNFGPASVPATSHSLS